MIMILSHKIKLRVNNKQASHLAKASGVARFAYNWALDQWSKQYELSKTDKTIPKPNQSRLRKQLNSVKRSNYPWMLEVTKTAPQMAIVHLGEAFNRFFKGKAKYPKFKRKGVNDSFEITNDLLRFNDTLDKVNLPKLGWVRMTEPLRFRGKVLRATVSKTAGHWYISFNVQIPDEPPKVHENQGIVGVDLGIKTLATLSTGEIFEGSKALKRNLKRLQRLSKNLSKKEKGSHNWVKAKLKLAKLHSKITNIRTDNLHKLTSYLSTTYKTIVIEDLNVSGMVRNRRLSRSISDMAFGEFKNQLGYKTAITGTILVVADRWYPSSKTCSSCGTIKKDLKLSDRIYKCHCGHQQDRDLNAVINLKNYAVSYTV